MKIIFVLILMLIPLETYAQQNFFNVPSFEITKKNKLFFQQQFNVNDSIESNSTFDWGFEDGLEIGFNIYGIEINNPLTSRNSTDGKFEHLTLLNFQKQLKYSDLVSLGIGSQLGALNSEFYFNGAAANIYASLILHRSGKFNFTVGPWLANDMYLRSVPSAAGIQAGGEWYLKRDHFALVIDSISGHTPISVTVVGFNYNLTRNWLLSMGNQIPNTKIANHAVVFELTYKDSE
ncbi:MAG: hypothetical protein AB7I27_12855 [Bacteriovoracaceae bacterium]